MMQAVPSARTCFIGRPPMRAVMNRMPPVKIALVLLPGRINADIIMIGRIT